MDVGLYSNKKNLVSISVPNNMRDDFGSQVVYLKEGKVYSPEESEESVRPIDEISISPKRGGLRGLEASMLDWNEKMGSEGPYDKPISLVFRGSKNNQLPEVYNAKRVGNLVHVLHNLILDDSKRNEGITGVFQPAMFFTYEISLQSLKPVEAIA